MDDLAAGTNFSLAGPMGWYCDYRIDIAVAFHYIENVLVRGNAVKIAPLQQGYRFDNFAFWQDGQMTAGYCVTAAVGMTGNGVCVLPWLVDVKIVRDIYLRLDIDTFCAAGILDDVIHIVLVASADLDRIGICLATDAGCIGELACCMVRAVDIFAFTDAGYLVFA